MIRVQLHHDSVIYGHLSWHQGSEWNVSLRPIEALTAMSQDLHAWAVATNATKLIMRDWSPAIQGLMLVMVEDFGYTLRVPNNPATPDDAAPYLESRS